MRAPRRRLSPIGDARAASFSRAGRANFGSPIPPLRRVASRRMHACGSETAISGSRKREASSRGTKRRRCDKNVRLSGFLAPSICRSSATQFTRRVRPEHDASRITSNPISERDLPVRGDAHSTRAMYNGRRGAAVPAESLSILMTLRNDRGAPTNEALMRTRRLIVFQSSRDNCKTKGDCLSGNYSRIVSLSFARARASTNGCLSKKGVTAIPRCRN